MTIDKYLTYRGDLQAIGDVDEATANALNALLQGWGLLDQKTYQVDGKVASVVSASVGGLRVVIVDKRVGDDVQLGAVDLAELPLADQPAGTFD